MPLLASVEAVGPVHRVIGLWPLGRAARRSTTKGARCRTTVMGRPLAWVFTLHRFLWQSAPIMLRRVSVPRSLRRKRISLMYVLVRRAESSPILPLPRVGTMKIMRGRSRIDDFVTSWCFIDLWFLRRRKGRGEGVKPLVLWS